MKCWGFWNNTHTLSIGSWCHYPMERLLRWNKKYEYRRADPLHAYLGSELVKNKVRNWTGDDRLYYHYSWVRPLDKIARKIARYQKWSGVYTGSYMQEVFLKWRDDPDGCGESTHPWHGGKCCQYSGLHPASVHAIPVYTKSAMSKSVSSAKGTDISGRMWLT